MDITPSTRAILSAWALDLALRLGLQSDAEATAQGLYAYAVHDGAVPEMGDEEQEHVREIVRDEVAAALSRQREAASRRLARRTLA